MSPSVCLSLSEIVSEMLCMLYFTQTLSTSEVEVTVNIF